MSKRTKSNANNRILFYNHQGKPCAWLEGDVLKRHARGSKHMLQRPMAWAFDYDIIDQAEKFGAKWVEVTDLETGQTYLVALSQFHTYGFEIDRGHGRQIALHLNRWQKGNQSVQLPLPLS